MIFRTYLTFIQISISWNYLRKSRLCIIHKSYSIDISFQLNYRRRIWNITSVKRISIIKFLRQYIFIYQWILAFFIKQNFTFTFTLSNILIIFFLIFLNKINWFSQWYYTFSWWVVISSCGWYYFLFIFYWYICNVVIILFI